MKNIMFFNLNFGIVTVTYLIVTFISKVTGNIIFSQDQAALFCFGLFLSIFFDTLWVGEK